MAESRDVSFSMPWDGSSGGQSKMPLKILVLAEFMARGLETGESPPGDRRVRIDKDSFAEVMAGFGLAPQIGVPDREAGPGREELRTVPLEGLRSFEPSEIARAAPRAAELLEVRRLVIELRDGKLDGKAFAAALSGATTDAELRDRIREALAGKAPAPRAPAAPTPAKDEATGGLDSLFDMIDVDASAEAAGEEVTPLTPSASTGRSPLDEVVSLIARTVGSGKPIEAATVTKVIRELDAEIATYVDETLCHPEIRRLEAVWRGLKLLVDRTDFRAGIRMEVISTPVGRVAEVLEGVVKSELSGASDVPVGLVVLDREFGNDPPETELLTSVAECGERMQVPVLTSVGAGFFGAAKARDVAGLGLLEMFDGPAMIRWQSLRKKESSRWLAVAFNRILTRMPYGGAGARVKGITYEEPAGRLVFASPVYGLAALVAGAVGRTGFAGRIAEPRGDGALENLPIWPAEGGRSVEVVVDDGRRKDLAKNGIVCFAGQNGLDSAVLTAVPTARKPEKMSNPDETEREKVRTNLAYQFFVARVAATLNAAGAGLQGGAGGDEVAMTYRAALEGLFGRDAEVSMRGGAITVTPSRNVAGGTAPLSFGA